MRFSLSEFMSDLSADAATVSLDMPDGGYDRLHHFLEQRGTLPRTKSGRTALVALMLVASRLVKQQLGPMGPVMNFINEIAEDGVREEAKRILAAAGQTVAATKHRGNDATGRDALWEMDDTSRRRLLEQYRQLDARGQQHMREQMLRSTVADLGILAGTSREDLRTLLDILAPVPVHRTGILDGIAGELFPWLKEKENRRRTWGS